MKYWTSSWNPVVGCTHAGSPGCDNCYAGRLHDQRHVAYLAGKKVPACYAQTFGQVICLEERLVMPLKWRKPRRIFVNSMSDLFHPDVPDEFLDKVFAVMALAPQHTFMVLTKRPERMNCYFTRLSPEHHRQVLERAVGAKFGEEAMCMAANSMDGVLGKGMSVGWPMQNLWLGVTAENQAQADARVPVLLSTPAIRRFVSVEPMLGPVNLRSIPVGCPDEGDSLDALAGFEVLGDAAYNVPGLNWVICGGESGPGANPMHPDWARSLRDQCEAARVPLFFKQWGEWTPTVGGRVHDDCDIPHGFRAPDLGWEDGVKSYRVGARRAGRLLDGREHDDMPKEDAQ